MRHIGKAIRYTRLREGLSPTELARQAKVAVSTITSIESGDQAPSLRTTSAIAEALNLKPIHLIMVADELEKKSSKFDALAKAEKELIDSALSILAGAHVKKGTKSISK